MSSCGGGEGTQSKFLGAERSCCQTASLLQKPVAGPRGRNYSKKIDKIRLSYQYKAPCCLPFLLPTTSRGPGSAFAHRCVSLSSNSTAPRVRVRCSWLGQWRYMRGTFLAVFIGSRPSVASPSGTPHSAQCPPEPLHTQVTKCVQTRCLPHPASPTLTPWSRSPFQTASWQRLGRHGRQHMLHVLLHGPVDVRRRLLGALLSPLAPLRKPSAPSNTPMRHTRSASVPTR